MAASAKEMTKEAWEKQLPLTITAKITEIASVAISVEGGKDQLLKVLEANYLNLTEQLHRLSYNAPILDENLVRNGRDAVIASLENIIKLYNPDYFFFIDTLASLQLFTYLNQAQNKIQEIAAMRTLCLTMLGVCDQIKVNLLQKQQATPTALRFSTTSPSGTNPPADDDSAPPASPAATGPRYSS